MTTLVSLGAGMRYQFQTHSFQCPNAAAVLKTTRKWVPYSRGGDSESGTETIVLSSTGNKVAEKVIAYAGRIMALRPDKFRSRLYFQPSVTWSEVGSGHWLDDNNPRAIFLTPPGQVCLAEGGPESSGYVYFVQMWSIFCAGSQPDSSPDCSKRSCSSSSAWN